MRLRSSLPLPILCAIVLAYAAFASIWAARVPPFMPPDEMAHADYMFAFFDAGRFYHIDDASSANDVLAQTKFLERVSGYRRLHYNRFGRVAPGYGDAKFLAAAAASAPAWSNRTRPPGSTMPYAMFVYPSTYYVLLAGFARAVTGGDPRAVVRAFFACRFLNVAFGAGTLLLAYGTFRNRGTNAATSLVAVVGIAMLPLFCWVSAYIQPDNLVIFLVTLAVYALSRKRAVVPLATLAVCALCLVKPLYGIVVWVPALAYVLSFARRRDAVLAAVSSLGMLPFMALTLALRLTPVSTGLADVGDTARTVAAGGASQVVALARALGSVARSVYLGGNVFENYWLGYGVHETRYFPNVATHRIALAFAVPTVFALFACALLYLGRTVRIARIGARRGAITALRLVARGVDVNVYVAYSALLVAASVLGIAPLRLEARYWLALAVPTTLLLVRELPRALPQRSRRVAASVVASTIVLMTLPVNLFTPSVIERDYYAAPAEQPRFDFGGLVVNDSGDLDAFNAKEARARLVDRIDLRGFALDVSSGLPADRVTIVSDGHVVARASHVSWRIEAEREWHDDVLDDAAFEALVPATRFGLGRHDVSVRAWRRGSTQRPLQHHVILIVSQECVPERARGAAATVSS